MTVSGTRADGRSAEQLRPVSIEPRFLTATPASCMIRMGETWVLCSGRGRRAGAIVPAGARTGLGYQRVRDDPALEPAAHPLEPRHQRRPPAGDQSPDRPRPARRDRHEATGRAPDHARLHRHSGRWRHAHRGRHGRVCGARPGDPRPARSGQAQAQPADHADCGRQLSGWCEARRCSTWRTSRTRSPTPTSTSSRRSAATWSKSRAQPKARRFRASS